ncbi:MAG: outer membrane protein assembly factor BamA [Pseudomonadota bacterium]
MSGHLKNAAFAICLALFTAVQSLAVPGALMGVSIVGVTTAQAAVVSSISVRGNQRVDADTVRSYITIEPGRSFSSFDTDESVRALFATGLFADVRIARQGRTLVVEVVENPIINLVRFEGNEKVKDNILRPAVQSKSLGIFSQEKLNSDVERITQTVRRSGRAGATVTARVDQLANNRVDVIFQINEGGRTKISSINFIGNNSYSDNRLMEVISHNESNFLSWLKRDDIFDQDRLQADEERLRLFYFNRGYADFRVISAVGDFDQASNSYTITITVDEGERYTFGTVTIDNSLSVVEGTDLRRFLQVAEGDTYSARKIEKSLISVTEAIAETGFAFAEVTPRGERDFENRRINITFFVDEGPRTYIERIDVRGNTRTRDYVIRREFDISEGDAYNRVLVNRAKTRLDALGFFEAVRIVTRPGSSPDRIVLVVQVKDKATGEISIGGGYSTTNGPIAEVSLSERNFLGRGQFLRVVGGYGTDSQRYQVSFTEPYFLGNRIAAGFDIQRETTESTNTIAYDTETTLGRLRASAPITENLRLSVNYTIKQEIATSDAAPGSLSIAATDAINNSPYLTSSIGWGFVYNTIDNRKAPREGIYFKFNQDFAGVGGDAQYIRTTAKATAYYLADEDRDIVLVGAVGAGNIFALGSDTLRVTDHFFLGGETIRGFAPVGFGPRATLGVDGVTPSNEALGGTTYFNVSAEVQFPIGVLPRSYGVRGALFADAGTLFGSDLNDPTANDDSSIRASIGASVIWDSPFGPLRADFAHPLMKERYDRTQFFRFGVSTRF